MQDGISVLSTTPNKISQSCIYLKKNIYATLIEIVMFDNSINLITFIHEIFCLNVIVFASPQPQLALYKKKEAYNYLILYYHKWSYFTY